jgi:hypothetical protein
MASPAGSPAMYASAGGPMQALMPPPGYIMVNTPQGIMLMPQSPTAMHPMPGAVSPHQQPMVAASSSGYYTQAPPGSVVSQGGQVYMMTPAGSVPMHQG